MDDRELLEAAARAAGVLTPSWYGNQAYIDGMLSRWNPLTSDADAFRLAVDLGLHVYPCNGSERNISEAMTVGNFADGKAELHGEDPYAATRRAITRAAAALSDQRQPPPAT